MTEDKFEKAIEDFFTWSWQTEVIVSCFIAVILFIIGLSFLKRSKKTAGWIFAGCGVLTIILDVLRLLLQALFQVNGG